MLLKADHDWWLTRKAGMARRRVQYGVVNASDADVGAGAPGFRATWQSKDDLRQQVMNLSDVPNSGKLYFWDGQLWLRWDDPDDLPGSEEDPLRIKIVCPQNAGMLLSSCVNSSQALCQMRINPTLLLVPRKQTRHSLASCCGHYRLYALSSSWCCKCLRLASLLCSLLNYWSSSCRSQCHTS